MDFISQFILEIFLVAPGAFIRWRFFRNKKFADVLNEDTPYNYLLSFASIIILTLTIVWVKAVCN